MWPVDIFQSATDSGRFITTLTDKYCGACETSQRKPKTTKTGNARIISIKVEQKKERGRESTMFVRFLPLFCRNIPATSRQQVINSVGFVCYAKENTQRGE